LKKYIKLKFALDHQLAVRNRLISVAARGAFRGAKRLNIGIENLPLSLLSLFPFFTPVLRLPLPSMSIKRQKKTKK